MGTNSADLLVRRQFMNGILNNDRPILSVVEMYYSDLVWRGSGRGLKWQRCGQRLFSVLSGIISPFINRENDEFEWS